MSFSPALNPTTDPRVRELAQEVANLGELFGKAKAARAAYDAIGARIEAGRRVGLEAPGALLQAQQELYNSLRPMWASVNQARMAFVPLVRNAAQRGAIRESDLQALADAGIVPIVNGRPSLPAGFGLGIAPLVIIAAIIVAGGVAGYSLDSVLSHIRQARTQSAQLEIAAQAAASVDAAWSKAQADAADDARRRGLPPPPVLAHPNATSNPAGNPSAGSGGGGGILSMFGASLAGGVSSLTLLGLGLGALWWWSNRK